MRFPNFNCVAIDDLGLNNQFHHWLCCFAEHVIAYPCYELKRFNSSLSVKGAAVDVVIKAARNKQINGYFWFYSCFTIMSTQLWYHSRVPLPYIYSCIDYVTFGDRLPWGLFFMLCNIEQHNWHIETEPKWPPFPQTAFSNAFLLMKSFIFRFEFHCSLFLRVVQLTMVQVMALRRSGDKSLSEPMVA